MVFLPFKFLPGSVILLGYWTIIGTIFSISVPGESDAYWNAYAKNRVEKTRRLNRYIPMSRVKNVILVIGDGMGMSTITAARILKGQLLSHMGEETVLAWEAFPFLALAKTYNTDHQVPDSAGTATAMLSGVKTKMSVLGLNDSCEYQMCSTVKESQIPSIADWFIQQGRSVGVVTSSRVTHATPAATYAHIPDRNLEADTDFEHFKVDRLRDDTIDSSLTENGNDILANKKDQTPFIQHPTLCRDIGWQLVNQNPGNKLKVVLGGGWRKLVTKNETLANLLNLATHRDNQTTTKNSLEKSVLLNGTENFEEITEVNNGKRVKRMVFSQKIMNWGNDTTLRGQRNDKNLVEEWVKLRKSSNDSYALVFSQQELKKVDPNNTDYLFGLFAHDHMSYVSKKEASSSEPTLLEMVTKAVDILSKDDAGYFLLVEGSRIDHAHHEGKARLALEETLELEKVVSYLVDRTQKSADLDEENKTADDSETLIIVTADHSHVFNLGGYPLRGNPIFGLNREYLTREFELSDVDDLPYTPLTYGNGPGGLNTKIYNQRPDVRNTKIDDPDYQAQAAIPLSEESHGGEDVPVYAIGPNAHLFSGTFEQHYINHAMSYASCVGPYIHEKHCSK